MNSIVAGVLNRALGDFIEDLDSDNLSLSVFSGIVDLKNVKVKANFVNDLPMPFALKHGYVGRIYIDIPWTSLTSKPLVIKISDVFLLIKAKSTD
mmetsp:Transcript_25146/g.11977  ORF Transcript_25146/g.11977 Transcript_25146/m.11977 type:complete len:95 (+) Transcript_25146:16-300(+)